MTQTIGRLLVIEAPDREPWWRTAVIYEIYSRSLADAGGDGEGDIAGITARLPYLAGLGVDAVWIAPWYPSPAAAGALGRPDRRGPGARPRVDAPALPHRAAPAEGDPRPTEGVVLSSRAGDGQAVEPDTTVWVVHA